MRVHSLLFLRGAKKVSQQLDFWSNEPQARQSDWVTPVRQALPALTAQSTLALACSSYLVPWVECMALALTVGAHLVNALAAEAIILVLGPGQALSKGFHDWWLETGFKLLGHAVTTVKVTPPRSAKGQASLVIPMSLTAEQCQQEVDFVMEQLRHYEPGNLSSSPLLWPSFNARITVPRLMMYLKVLRHVLEQPAEAKDKVFRVGEQMNLVPMQRPHSTDTTAERQKKREAITHQAFDYYQKGKALMINATRGDFPNVVMPRDLVQTRRKARKKIEVSRYDRWGKGARIVPAVPSRQSREANDCSQRRDSA